MNNFFLIHKSTDFSLKRKELTEDVASTDFSLNLNSITGSEGIHLCIESKESNIVKQVQIKCRPNETLNVKFGLDSSNSEIEVLTTNSQLLVLPPDRLYKPENQSFIISDNQQIDILFILDGTMQSSSLNEFSDNKENSRFLIDFDSFDALLSEKLNLFLKIINAESQDLRCSFLSFADKSIPKTNANNLKSQYILDPEDEVDRFFDVWSDDQVVDQIKQMRGSSGGDYIDELAGAIHAATEDYNWRPEARKLVFIIGDSPGFSILKPAPTIGGIQANALVRYFDIDSEVAHLHRNGIEVMTLYMSDEQLYRSTKGLDRYKYYTQQQYKDLASLDEYSSIWGEWDPEKSSSRFLKQTKQLIGRGFCYPILQKE